METMPALFAGAPTADFAESLATMAESLRICVESFTLFTAGLAAFAAFFPVRIVSCKGLAACGATRKGPPLEARQSATKVIRKASIFDLKFVQM